MSKRPYNDRAKTGKNKCSVTWALEEWPWVTCCERTAGHEGKCTDHRERHP